MSSLLFGWSDYFTTHSANCDYDVPDLAIDSVMVILMILQIICQKYFI